MKQAKQRQTDLRHQIGRQSVSSAHSSDATRVESIFAPPAIALATGAEPIQLNWPDANGKHRDAARIWRYRDEYRQHVVAVQAATQRSQAVCSRNDMTDRAAAQVAAMES
jgi:hypothetical protein